MDMQDGLNWIIEETQSANFGDKRLNKRYGHLLNSFASAPNKSIPGAFKSWKETIAAYRFFNNENVTSNEIISPHREATLERIKKEKVVLIPQDTTEIDFSGRKSISGMGYLGSEYSQGFYLHPSLAVTPERSCLGIVDMQVWTRKKLGLRKDRGKKPVEEKESYCWMKGYEAANAIATIAPDTAIISIADREGDIYELLDKTPSRSNKAYWLVRCQHNRRLLDENGKKFELHLREVVQASNPIGEVEFKLPKGKTYNREKFKRHAREDRTVRQEIRVSTVNIRPPKSKRTKSAPATINVVHCREIYSRA